MATIKDIAALAGVSHGTVSNVLNGRGNVSVEKIMVVENAAKQLGYTINAQARQLRKGVSRRVGIVVPQIKLRQYRDLILGIERELISQEYEVDLYYSDDLNHNEEKALQKIEMTNPVAIVVVSSFLKASNPVRGSSQLIFVERFPDGLPEESVYFGFDYRQAGREMAARCSGDGHRNVAVFTGNPKYSNYHLFSQGIVEGFKDTDVDYRFFTADDSLRVHMAFDFLACQEEFDAVITTDLESTDYIRKASLYGQKKNLPQMYALTGKELLSEQGITKYELNYGLCGKQIGKYIEKLEEGDGNPTDLLKMKNDGFCEPAFHPCEKGEEIRILMISGPTSRAVSHLLPQFTEKTGIKVKMMEVGYDELYRMAKACTKSSLYDLIRMDMAWMSELGEKVYAPMSEQEEWFQQIKHGFSASLNDDYYKVGDAYLAFPFDPSVQVLYYRKDLFEDAKIRREFYEEYRRRLEVPKTFREFDETARFFTRKYYKNSPVAYGTSMVFGSSVVAACDYLPRLKAEGGSVFGEDGRICLEKELLVKTLEDYKCALEYTDKEINSWWKNAMESFSDGQVAMDIVFANYASLMLHSKKSEMLGKIGFAPVPGGHPMLGGGVLGISRYSKKQRACIEFLKWIYDEKTAAVITYLGGYINHKKLKENLEILELYPWIEGMEKAFASGWRREGEHIVSGFQEFAFEDILGNAVRSAVSGMMDPSDALKMAQEECERAFEN